MNRAPRRSPLSLCLALTSTPVRALALALALLLVGAASGCSDDDSTPPDRGADIAAGDGGVDAADSGDDLPNPDQGVDAPASRCSASATLDPLTLSSAYCVAYRFELPAAPTAFAVRGNTVYTFAETSTAKTYEVLEQPINSASGALGAASTFFTFSVTSSETLFATMYLPVSPGGKIAAGYNTSNPTAPQGEIFIGANGGTPDATQADGNFDAAFIDDSTLLLNGGAAGTLSGQGLYVLRDGRAPALLIKEVGDFSGPVVVSKDLVYTGGYFSSASEGRLYAFTLAEVKAAIANATQLTASDGDLAFAGNQLGAAGLDGDLVVAKADSSFAFTSVARYPASVGASDSVSVGSPSDIVTAGSAGTFGNIESDGGSLVVQFSDANQKAQLAIIDKK